MYCVNIIYPNEQIIIKVKYMELKSAFFKTIIGILLYFAIIDIVIYLQVGIPSTPLDWIYVPIYNIKH